MSYSSQTQPKQAPAKAAETSSKPAETPAAAPSTVDTAATAPAYVPATAAPSAAKPETEGKGDSNPASVRSVSACQKTKDERGSQFGETADTDTDTGYFIISIFWEIKSRFTCAVYHKNKRVMHIKQVLSDILWKMSLVDLERALGADGLCS